MSLAELLQVNVTTLSRSEESKDLAPGSIYVFDAETIHKRGYRSIADQSAFDRVDSEYVEIDKQMHIDLCATYVDLYGGSIDIGFLEWLIWVQSGQLIRV